VPSTEPLATSQQARPHVLEQLGSGDANVPASLITIVEEGLGFITFTTNAVIASRLKYAPAITTTAISPSNKYAESGLGALSSSRFSSLLRFGITILSIRHYYIFINTNYPVVICAF
jgi:hypothetical protein